MRTRLAAIVVNTVLALLVPVALLAALAATLLLAWNVLLRHGIGWALVSLIVGGPVIFGVARLLTFVISMPFALLSEGIGRLVEPPQPPVKPAVLEAAVRAAAEQRHRALENLTQREEAASTDRHETSLDEAKSGRASDPEPARSREEAHEPRLESDLLNVPPLDEHSLRTTGPLHLRHHFRSEKRES